MGGRRSGLVPRAADLPRYVRRVCAAPFAPTPSGGPLVSVVLPAFDRLSCLRQAVDSVFRQTWRQWELVISDDGSGPDTRAFLASLRDPRVHVVWLPHSGNPGRARNAALAAARGSHVAFLDSDDLWEPDKLAAQLDGLRASPGRRWCYTAVAYMDADVGRRRWRARRDPARARVLGCSPTGMIVCRLRLSGLLLSLLAAGCLYDYQALGGRSGAGGGGQAGTTGGDGFQSSGTGGPGGGRGGDPGIGGRGGTVAPPLDGGDGDGAGAGGGPPGSGGKAMGGSAGTGGPAGTGGGSAGTGGRAGTGGGAAAAGGSAGSHVGGSGGEDHGGAGKGGASGAAGVGSGGVGTAGTGGSSVAPQVLSIDFNGGFAPATGGSGGAAGAAGAAGAGGGGGAAATPLVSLPAMAPTEVAGFKPAAHWNNAPGLAGSVAGLVLTDGSVTGATVTWNSPPSATGRGIWWCGYADAPGNVRMMNGYLDPHSADMPNLPATIVVTGLPAAITTGGYDVYLYVTGEVPSGTTRTSRYAIGAASSTVTQTGPSPTTFPGFTLVSTTGVGNTIVFRGLTDSFFTLTATPGTGGRAPVNGIQIVSPSGS